MTCRGCGPSPDPEQDREHNDWCPDNPRRAHRGTTSINEATAKAHPEYNMPVARDAGWTIPASMLTPATPPDHYTLDQVRVMLHIALTDRTLESTTRPLDERIAVLLAMFPTSAKEKP